MAILNPAKHGIEPSMDVIPGSQITAGPGAKTIRFSIAVKQNVSIVHDRAFKSIDEE
jgi:hypothetical protein